MNEDEFRQAVLSQLSQLRNGQAELHARFDRVDGRMDAIHARLEDHDDRFDSLDRRLTIVENRMSSIEVRLGGIEVNVSYVAKNTEIALEKIRTVNRRVDLLENPQGPSGKGY